MSLLTSLLGAVQVGLTMPRSLPLRAHRAIHSHLDRRTAHTYSTLCKEFRSFSALNVRAERLAQYILENYEILGAGTSKETIIEFLFRAVGVICCEDDPVVPCHQRLNAGLVNALFVFHFKGCLIEGGNRSLAQWKKDKAYLFRFLVPEISVQSWDLEIEEGSSMEMIIKARLSYVYKKIVLIQKFFGVFTASWKMEDLDAVLRDLCGDQTTINGFWNLYSKTVGAVLRISLPPIQVMASHPFFKELLGELLKLTSVSFIANAVPEKYPYQTETAEHLKKRKQQLAHRTLETLRRGQKKCFFAGSDYIHALHRLLTNRFCLFLIPKKGLSERSVLASESRWFSFDAPKKIYAKVQAKASSKSTDTPLGLEGLMKQMLAFDASTLNYGDNHHQMWNERADKLIELQQEQSLRKCVVLRTFL
jgi:hypothetical protein